MHAYSFFLSLTHTNWQHACTTFWHSLILITNRDTSSLPLALLHLSCTQQTRTLAENVALSVPSLPPPNINEKACCYCHECAPIHLYFILARTQILSPSPSLWLSLALARFCMHNPATSILFTDIPAPTYTLTYAPHTAHVCKTRHTSRKVSTWWCMICGSRPWHFVIVHVHSAFLAKYIGRSFSYLPSLPPCISASLTHLQHLLSTPFTRVHANEPTHTSNVYLLNRCLDSSWEWEYVRKYCMLVASFKLCVCESERENTCAWGCARIYAKRNLLMDAHRQWLYVNSGAEDMQ